MIVARLLMGRDMEPYLSHILTKSAVDTAGYETARGIFFTLLQRIAAATRVQFVTDFVKTLIHAQKLDRHA